MNLPEKLGDQHFRTFTNFEYEHELRFSSSYYRTLAFAPLGRFHLLEDTELDVKASYS